MHPINTAICSFGMSGWVFHSPFLHIHPGFNLYAVLERSKDSAKEKYPGIKTYRTLEDMLADSSIELVVVNTPNATHFEFAKAALLSGKHVIVEKPFVVTVAQGIELILLAKNKNLVLSVYHNRRYDSDFKTIQKIVQEKLLGELVEVEMHFDRFKEELSPKQHKEIPGQGGGILYDLGSHLIDQALQLFGKPHSVFADIRLLRAASQVDDYFELLLYYKKLRVRLKASYVVRESLPGYILHGLKGSFIKPKTDIQETELKNGMEPGKAGWGKEPESERGFLHTEVNGNVIKNWVDSEQGNYGEYYDGIYLAIRNQLPAPVSAGDGLAVIKVIETAFQSSIEKRVLPVSL